MPTTATNETRQVPKNALTLHLGKLEFGKVDGEHGPEAPISMLARSGEPIVHWYWGRIVHDMSGMKLRKPTCPLDYCHYDWDPIGVGETFAVTDEGLRVSGRLISFKPDDRAAEIIFKGSRGVPYEASIDFSDGLAKIEEILPGQVVQVNGYDFMGPGYVVREWSLLGVAVCPFGADPHTLSEFSKKDKEPETLSISIFKLSSSMPPEADPTAAPTNPSTTTATGSAPPAAATQLTQPATPTPDDPRAQLRAELNRFCTRFGAEQGAKWFNEGLNYETALEQFATNLSSKNEELTKKVADLEQRLSLAKPPGESQPASFSDAEHPAKTEAPKLNNLSENLNRFADGIKLPGKKK